MQDGLSSGFHLRYRLMQCLGSGAMGTVYRAQQTALNRTVAVKLLRLDPESPFGQRFIVEAKVLAALAHPGIVKVFDFGWDSAVPFLVMEFIDGCTLRGELRSRGRLPTDEAVAMLLELLDAASYMHKQGVLHRDLKPENILIDGTGQLYLADFGLALDANSTRTRLTEQGTVMGTARYMAPELFEGGDFSVSSDLYALGVVAFELFTGALPFDAHDGPGMVQAKLAGPLLRARSVEPSLPQALEDLLARVLDRRPPMRPESARELAAELSKLLAPTDSAGSGPGAAPQPAARAPSVRRVLAVPVAGPGNDTATVRRRSLRTLIGFTLFVGVIVSTTVLATRERRAPIAQSPAPGSAARSPVDPPIEALRTRLDEALGAFSARRRHEMLARDWVDKMRGSGDATARVSWMTRQFAAVLDAARRLDLDGKIAGFRRSRSHSGQPPAPSELATYRALHELLDLQQFFRVAAAPIIRPPPSLGADLAQPLPQPWRERPRRGLVAARVIALETVDPVHRRSEDWDGPVDRHDAWVGAGFHTRLVSTSTTFAGQEMLRSEEAEERLKYDHPVPLSADPSKAAEIALVGNDKKKEYSTFHVLISRRPGDWQAVAVFREALDRELRYVAVDPALLAGSFRVRVEMRPIDGLHVHCRANLFAVGLLFGAPAPGGH